MKLKFKFDYRIVKRAILIILLTALVTVFTVSIVNSFNPNHVLSKSHAPEIMIPSGSYENFLKRKANIPADALDKYPLVFSDLSLPTLQDDIVINGVDATIFHAEGFRVDTENFPEPVLVTSNTGFAQWTIPGIVTTGLYNVYVEYYPVEGGGATIERAVYINIDMNITDPNAKYETQYDNLKNVKFSRFFKDKDAIVQDLSDNDMKPRQLEILDQKRTAYLKDETGYIVEPYLVALNGGIDNTITFESIRESMAIASIVITSYQAKESYSEYYNRFYNEGYREVNIDKPIRIEGEDASERTSPTLYAISDRSDPLNNPVHPVKIKLNAIGGGKWNIPGDAITWEIDLTDYESGFYQISFRSKQNVSRGLFSTRRIYINGEIPFMEASSARFTYSSKYNIVTLGSETEPFFFALEGGKVNTITLEATLGDYGVSIGRVQDVVNMLNDVYLRIIAVTTANPDPYQNYYLVGENARVERVLETFTEAANLLEQVSTDITALSGEKSDKVAILDTMRYQLEDMVKNPRTIQQRLQSFARNISALGTWINEIKQQALIVEALFIHSSETKLPKANSNFFVGTWFDIRGFVLSFFFDYESIGIFGDIEGARKIEVWFLTSETTGREQANSISTLITTTLNDFIEEENLRTGSDKAPIQVKLKVVAAGVLLPATLANRGPDVAINVANGLPVNYAMRKAIKDISDFEDFYQVTGICSASNAAQGLCEYGKDYNEGRIDNNFSIPGTEQYLFFESTMVPYEYNGGYYGLPNTQSFLVMFYRNDIFEKRGWTVPESWRDVTSLVTELSISNLQFYLPLAASGATSVVNQVFASMLYQRGGTFYRNENRESNFDSEEAMLAFEEWTKYYTDYSFPLAASFVNRFRTGETPIGIVGYELFNTLTVFAPEIAGKWSFAPLPGTYDKDGVLHNQGAASGSAIVMMKNAKDPEASWDFMKWWISKDTQREYARELESILGAAARHNTANALAFKELPWTRTEMDVLLSQWENSVGVPEVPGGYYTGRNIENAFREVVNTRANPRETLSEYIILINAEISKKRKEFKLD